MSNGLDPDQDKHSVSVLVWVQTVCKGYQQKTKNATSKESVHTAVPSGARSLKIRFESS